MFQQIGQILDQHANDAIEFFKAQGFNEQVLLVALLLAVVILIVARLAYVLLLRPIGLSLRTLVVTLRRPVAPVLVPEPVVVVPKAKHDPVARYGILNQHGNYSMHEWPSALGADLTGNWELYNVSYAEAVAYLHERNYDYLKLAIAPAPIVKTDGDVEDPLVYLVLVKKDWTKVPATCEVEKGDRKNGVILVGGKMLPDLADEIVGRITAKKDAA